MKKSAYFSAILIATVSGMATAAHAADTATDDDSLTKYGITFYGTIDLGVQYQTHGAPINGSFIIGSEPIISKNSNNAIFGVIPSGMSQSMLGLKGAEDIVDGLQAIFKAELQFDPNSGNLANGPGSVAQNNNIALANQSANGDSSRAGELFGGQVFGGLSSKDYGTLTVGRHNTFMLDDVIKYDPNGASYAFSWIGYSGTTAGMGDTEASRADGSIKYVYDAGLWHAGGLFKMGGYGSAEGNEYEVQAGANIGGLSVDAHYGIVKDAVSVSAASSGFLTSSNPNVYAANNSLAATVSDNYTFSLTGLYQLMDALKIYAGYEHITYENPTAPLSVGATTIGGYTLGTVNNNAYANNKILNIFWLGAKYSVTPNFDVTAAWYHEGQNAYGGCTDTSSAACSGALNAVSLVFNERLNKHFDLYQGAMYSTVSNGLANGYLYTNTLDPTVGGRWRF